MTWLDGVFAGQNTHPQHINENDTADEKALRLSTLSGEEPKVYKWLFEGYTEAWTTETMGLEKRDAKKLYNNIYRKLGVRNAREIVHYYAPRDVRFIKASGMNDEENEPDKAL